MAVTVPVQRLKWNEFQMLVRGRGWSKQQVSAAYEAHKASGMLPAPAPVMQAQHAPLGARVGAALRSIFSRRTSGPVDGTTTPPTSAFATPAASCSTSGVQRGGTEESDTACSASAAPACSASVAPACSTRPEAPAEPAVHVAAVTTAAASRPLAQWWRPKAKAPIGYSSVTAQVRRREDVDDKDEIFAGFGEWRLIKTSDVGERPPMVPGNYEWGTQVPGGGSPIVAFYYGKAGGNSKETLRTRFNKYVTTTRYMVGPVREAKKMALFEELQRRGFSIWYRCRPCAPGQDAGAVQGSLENPEARETWTLAQLDYAACKNKNGAYRNIAFPGGATLEDFPRVLDGKLRPVRSVSK